VKTHLNVSTDTETQDFAVTVFPAYFMPEAMALVFLESPLSPTLTTLIIVPLCSPKLKG
jgi:hypothetical protein